MCDGVTTAPSLAAILRAQLQWHKRRHRLHGYSLRSSSGSGAYVAQYRAVVIR
jgi:hypothetical protein